MHPLHAAKTVQIRLAKRAAFSLGLAAFCAATSQAQNFVDQQRGTIPASPWSFQSQSVSTSLPSNPPSSAPSFVKQPRSTKGAPKSTATSPSTSSPSHVQPTTPSPNTSSGLLQIDAPVGRPMSGPGLLAPVPVEEQVPVRETVPMQESVEPIQMGPAYPDNQGFTLSPSVPPQPAQQQTLNWETLPRDGMVLVSDARSSSLPGGGGVPAGLPDRQGAGVHSLPSMVRDGSGNSSQDWYSESLRLAAEQKHRIGSQVSNEILKDMDAPLESRPYAIEPPIGWQAIEQDLKNHLTQCDELLRRGAVFSGKQQALIAIRLLLRHLDQRRSQWTSEPYLDQALVAFREEAEFHASMQNPEQSKAVHEIVLGHQTPALKGTTLTNVPPGIAAQYYQHFAKDRLIAAAERHPWASDLYYAYGKCLEKQAEESTSDRVMLLGQAAACYQAALASKEQNAQAANQLGFVLLRLDRNDEAQMYLNHSIQLNPTVETYKNLAELYRRRGDNQGVGRVTSQIAAIQGDGAVKKNLPTVQEVDPATFAAMSPRTIMTGGPQGGPGQMAQPMAQSSPLSQGSTSPMPVQTAAPTSSSWFGRLFR